MLAQVLALPLPNERRMALANSLQNLLRAKRLAEVRHLLGHQRNPTAFVLEVHGLCRELAHGRVHVAAQP
jgi:hypothetical protein